MSEIEKVTVYNLDGSAQNFVPEEGEPTDPDLDALIARVEELEATALEHTTELADLLTALQTHDHPHEHPGGGGGGAYEPETIFYDRYDLPIFAEESDGGLNRVELGSEGIVEAEFTFDSPYTVQFRILIAPDGLDPAPDPQVGKWRIWLPSPVWPKSAKTFRGQTFAKNSRGNIEPAWFFGPAKMHATGDPNWPWAVVPMMQHDREGNTMKWSPEYDGFHENFRLRGGDYIEIKGHYFIANPRAVPGQEGIVSRFGQAVRATASRAVNFVRRS